MRVLESSLPSAAAKSLIQVFRPVVFTRLDVLADRS